MDGVLLLDKPAGMTSHDCVNIVRKVLKTKKVGHTGTLDPSVTGVLPICVGRATKISQFLTANEKEGRQGTVPCLLLFKQKCKAC